tara:strand:+ start:2633 stop:2962 length:330 start_codon:yes stop_codon:yes gene_type:complete
MTEVSPTNLNNKESKNVKKEKKQKKKIVYRTKEERQGEVKEILNQLSKFDLNIKYEPIKKLYKLFKEYINEDRRIEVNIPFPEIDRRIKGLLAISVREDTWVNLKHENF